MNRAHGSVRVIGFIARSGRRRRTTSALVLVVLIAIAGGIILAAWAGSRRTESAYGRLVAATNHADLIVTSGGDPSLFDPSIAVAGPGVASSAVIDGFGSLEILPDGTLGLSANLTLVAPTDLVGFRELDHPLVLAGRQPDPDAVDEVIVDETARDLGHPLGSTIDMCIFHFADLAAFGDVLTNVPTPEQQRAFIEDVCAVHHLLVVGIEGKGPDSVVLREQSERQGNVIGTPALVAAPGPPRSFSFVLVDLAPGADVNAYIGEVLDRSSPDAGVAVQAAALHSTVVSRTVAPHVRALALFAAIAAIAALGVLGPAIVRSAAFAEPDRASLLAVGLCAYQLRLACALRGAVMGAAGAAGAVVIAIGLSGFFPIGVADRIEPDPGLRLDGLVLAIGVGVIVALCAGLGAVAVTRARSKVRRPSRVADGLQAWGVAPAVVAGVRAAASRESRGAGAFPTAGGVAIAIAAVVTALTYQAGLGRLLETPSRYGWTWDAVIDVQDGSLPPELLGVLQDDPAVTGLSTGRRSSLLRDGTAVPTFAFDPVRGSLYPSIIEGRAPRGDAEIALGGQTLDRFGAALGDHLVFRGPSGVKIDVAVVGRTVIPLASVDQDLSVAETALVDGPLLDRIGGAEPSLLIVDLAPGTSAADLPALLERRGVVVPPQGSGISGPSYTADLRGYDAVRNTPLLLAGLLAVLGLGVLAHTITTTAHRRRRELAILRCLGFSRRDLRATVRWAALTIVGVCLVVSLPIGIGVGRALWSAFAGDIGVVADSVTPVLQLAAVVVATLVAALVLAAFPGRRAGQMRPAEVLRSE